MKLIRKIAVGVPVIILVLYLISVVIGNRTKVEAKKAVINVEKIGEGVRELKDAFSKGYHNKDSVKKDSIE